MRARLKGINTIRKRLADGSVAVYHYHRDTGARLPGDPGSPEFLSAYAEAERTVPRDTGKLAALIREYLLSLTFEKKATSTRREYQRMLSKIEAEFGTMPIRALESRKVKGLFLDYQERIGRDTPREADNRLTVLSAVLTYATRRGRIAVNPLEGFERLHHKDRADLIWTEADVERFMRGAPVELQRALILAMHTGQRYGDLIRLRWADYDGGTIALRQRKTQQPVRIACTATLRQMLDTAPRSGPFILTRPDGRPWHTERDDKALSKAWHQHMVAAGFYPRPWDQMTAAEKRAHVQFRDLRGTAVTLLSEAGASVPQIVAITGHTMQSAHRILERYLARTPALSAAAILHFENAPATAFANRLQTGAGPVQAQPKKG